MKKKLIIFILLLFLLPVILLIYFTLLEYNPKLEENILINNNVDKIISFNKNYNISTFNIGYAGLGENETFLLDGGKGIYPVKNRHLKYFEGIKKNIKDLKSDFYFIQEIDQSSTRSYNINQIKEIEKTLNYASVYARNLYVKYSVLPPFLFPYGKVDTGIATFSKYNISSSKRIQLYNPFKWPVKIFNFKRAIILNEIDIKNSDKKLILINLHLDAYSDDKSRVLQLKDIYNIANDEFNKGNYVIVGGDFNQLLTKDYSSNPYWAPSNIDISDFKNFKIYTGKKSTCVLNDRPVLMDNYFFVLDGFLVSSNIEVLKIQTVDYKFSNSDHNPVKLKFKLKK